MNTNALLTAAVASVLLLPLSGCVPAYGFSKTSDGQESRSKFCDSVRRFVRAPLDSAGLRRAWFLPMGSYADGSIDFYAPMAAKPADKHSSAFYENKVGQLTHYTLAPEHGFEMAKCLSGRYGFERKALEMQDDHMRGSFVDTRSKRRIEILGADYKSSILVASMDWKGDVDEKMQYRCAEECP